MFLDFRNFGCPSTSVSKSYLDLYLLCTTNERKLLNIFVGDINGDLLSLGNTVSDTNFDSSLNIIVWNRNAGGESIFVPVVFNSSRCLCGLFTL